MKEAPKTGTKVRYIKPGDEYNGAIGTVYCQGMMGGNIKDEELDAQGIPLAHTLVLDKRTNKGEPIFMLVDRKDIEPFK